MKSRSTHSRAPCCPPWDRSLCSTGRATGDLQLNLRSQRVEDVFGKQRDRIKTNFQRVFHGIDNRGSRAIHWEFPDSLGAKRAVNIAKFLEENSDGRKVS